MADPEIKVKVVIPEGGTPPEETPPEETVVVVAGESGGTDPGTILSLEMLRDQVTVLTEALATSNARLDLALLELTGMQNRLIDLESEEAEEIIEEGEIPVETIPPVVEETLIEDTQPEKRKRRFI